MDARKLFVYPLDRISRPELYPAFLFASPTKPSRCRRRYTHPAQHYRDSLRPRGVQALDLLSVEDGEGQEGVGGMMPSPTRLCCSGRPLRNAREVLTLIGKQGLPAFTAMQGLFYSCVFCLSELLGESEGCANKKKP